MALRYEWKNPRVLELLREIIIVLAKTKEHSSLIHHAMLEYSLWLKTTKACS
jgi:hypothetical protein